MIELVFLSLATIVLGGWIVLVITSITIADLRQIKLEKAFQRHPNSRKWRIKPLVSVIYNRQPTIESEASIRNGTYRNLTIMKSSGSRIRGLHILRINYSDILEKTALRDANVHLQYNESTRFVQIIPRLEFPQTMMQFFVAYHRIALAPFIRVRATFGIRPNDSFWPVLERKNLQPNQFEKYYAGAKWVVNATNLALFLYVANIAVILDQPDYLMAYMTAFGMWLAWSITNYPRLVLRQKLAYLLLAPAAFVYFLWRIMAAPFAPLHFISVQPILRRVLS
jgi:hypothetical protein